MKLKAPKGDALVAIAIIALLILLASLGQKLWAPPASAGSQAFTSSQEAVDARAPSGGAQVTAPTQAAPSPSVPPAAAPTPPAADPWVERGNRPQYTCERAFCDLGRVPPPSGPGLGFRWTPNGTCLVADLDGKKGKELLVFLEDSLRVYASDGKTPRVTIPFRIEESTTTPLPIGVLQLDDDPAPELLVAADDRGVDEYEERAWSLFAIDLPDSIVGAGRQSASNSLQAEIDADPELRTLVRRYKAFDSDPDEFLGDLDNWGSDPEMELQRYFMEHPEKKHLSDTVFGPLPSAPRREPAPDPYTYRPDEPGYPIDPEQKANIDRFNGPGFTWPPERTQARDTARKPSLAARRLRGAYPGDPSRRLSGDAGYMTTVFEPRDHLVNSLAGLPCFVQPKQDSISSWTLTRSGLGDVVITNLEEARDSGAAHVADFDGDGAADVLYPGSSGRGAELYLANRNGTFGGREDFARRRPGIAIGMGDSGVAYVGDVNDDGKPDLLSQERGALVVRQGRGEVGYDEAIAIGSLPYPLRAIPSLSRMLDLNGDGCRDLVLLPDEEMIRATGLDYGIPPDRPLLCLLWRTGDVGLPYRGNLVRLDTGGPTTGVLLEDMNEDGLADIIAWSFTPSRCSVCVSFSARP